MDEKIEEKVGKELYNDLASIMSEEYEKRMLITPSYCANKLLKKGYRKESDTAREISQDLESSLMYYRDSDISCEFVFGIMDGIAKKHGVKAK